MFVYYACCDAELESSIKVISGDLLGWVPTRLPCGIAYSVVGTPPSGSKHS